MKVNWKQIHKTAAVIRAEAALRWKCEVREIDYPSCVSMAIRGEQVPREKKMDNAITIVKPIGNFVVTQKETDAYSFWVETPAGQKLIGSFSEKEKLIRFGFEKFEHDGKEYTAISLDTESFAAIRKIVNAREQEQRKKRLYVKNDGQISIKLTDSEWKKIAHLMKKVNKSEYDPDAEDEMRFWVEWQVKEGHIEEVEKILEVLPEQTQKARKERKEKLEALRSRHAELKRAILATFDRKNGEYVKEEKQISLQGERVNFDGIDGEIYGGGRWFRIEADSIWFIQNNGHDGDDWSLSNVSTGGAGAIGHKFPRTQEGEALVREWTAVESEIKKLANSL